MNLTVQRVLNGLIALMVPFFLMMTAIRLLFIPLYPQVVYRTPGFPADAYGFTLEDRLHWSRISIEYLINDAGIEYLADQQLPDGAPLYNERELSHMYDVKVLVQKMITAWTVLLVLLLGLAIWAWRGGWLGSFLNALASGGKLTIGIIVLILAGVAISFNQLFTLFHRLFFTGDTWLFAYSDSLIRLFPIPFWMYAFILMGVFTLAGAGVLIWLGRKYK
jgi:integral membrane protein (TIGR01906 family)